MPSLHLAYLKPMTFKIRNIDNAFPLDPTASCIFRTNVGNSPAAHMSNILCLKTSLLKSSKSVFLRLYCLPGKWNCILPLVFNEDLPSLIIFFAQF
jgi:hypothetical protein